MTDSDDQGDGIMEDLLLPLSFDNISASSSASLDVEALLSKQSPASLIASIIPHLFHTDAGHRSAAERLLTSILSYKPSVSTSASPSPSINVSMLSITTASILSFIQTLTPSTEFNISNSTLQLMVNQLTHSTISIADNISNAIQSLTSIRPPLITDILELIQPIIKKDATVMIRCYALIFQIIPSDFMNCNENTLYEDIMQPLMDGLANEDDALLQMSLLEILETTGQNTEEGRGRTQELIQNWDNTNLDKILLRMVGYPKGDLHPFCAGAALRILAIKGGRVHVYVHVHSHSDSLMEEDPFMTGEEFVKVLLHFGRNMNGEIEKIGFIDGIATFCKLSEEKLEMVLENQELLEEWLNLRRGQSKLKAVVMSSVSNVLMGGLELEQQQEQVQVQAQAQDARKRSHAIKLKLFQMIGTANDVGRGQDSSELIMEYVKGQVVELRLAAYELLTGVARINMGSHMLMQFGGFFEFLCNRNLEVVKEGKVLKYALVNAVVESDVAGLLAEDIVKMLEQVVADGPFFVKQVRDVALV